MRYTTRGMSVLDRLEKKSTDVGECREWSGYTNASGYGVIKIDGKPVLTNRATYAAHNPDVDITGKVIQHSCDNPKCIRISHLSVGTDLTNAQDRKSKDRSAQVLTNAQRADIQQLLLSGAVARHVARAFGVSESRVSQLKKEALNV